MGAGVGGRGGVHWHGRRRRTLAGEAVADAGVGGGGTRGAAEREQGWIGFPFAWATDSVPKGYDSARAYGEKI